MVKCPHCGELVADERQVCIGCGRPVHDPSRPLDRRLRAGLIAIFVAGGLVLIGGMIRDAFLHR